MPHDRSANYRFGQAMGTGSRRRFLGALAAAIGGIAAGGGCSIPGGPATDSIPRPTPFPPRPGDPDEVRLGLLGTEQGVPAAPLDRAARALSGTSAIGKLRLVAVQVPTFGSLTDPDTGHFLGDPSKVLSATLLAIQGALPADRWADLLPVANLDQVRAAARRRLLLPVDPPLAGAPGAIADAWPGAEAVFHDRGRAWGVPIAVRPLVLTYQPRWFARQHVALPTSGWGWPQLLAAAKSLTILGPTGGVYGFLATAPDSLPVFVWQAGGEVVTGQGKAARCALATPAALAGQRFVFDLIHRDGVSPHETLSGRYTGAAVMQLGPAVGSDFVLPPRGELQATGYSLSVATGLVVPAWARDAERAARAARALAAATQGQYDWPVSRAAAERLERAGGPAATAVAALRLVHPPGLVADIRGAVESAALGMANELVTPSAAVLDDRQLVREAAQASCQAIGKALHGLP